MLYSKHTIYHTYYIAYIYMLNTMLYSSSLRWAQHVLYSMVYSLLYNMFITCRITGPAWRRSSEYVHCQRTSRSGARLKIQKWSSRAEGFDLANSTPSWLQSPACGSWYAWAIDEGHRGWRYPCAWSEGRGGRRSGCKAIQKTSPEGIERAAL